ncbi:MAG: hypothetical protein P8P83_00140 [Rickettsiaceae bacterium]|nr:hypothetical protein [Rickettsiaceae bacterium]
MTQENTNDDIQDEAKIAENAEHPENSQYHAGLWGAAGVAGTMILGLGTTVILSKFSENNDEFSILASQICMGTASLISMGITGVACYYSDLDDFAEAFS